MPRKKYIPTTVFPYHISNRCNNKEWFRLPLPLVWNIFCAQLQDSSERYSVLLHSFVLMSNHFHLMVSTPMGNLDSFLRHFLTETARAIQRASGRINHIFGGRSSQTVLDTPYSVAYVYKYIYRNPIRAGLASKVEDYRFGTLYDLHKNDGALGLVEGIGPLWSLIPKPPIERLDWLNLPSQKEHEALIAKALRRSRFQFSRSNECRKSLEALSQTYAVRPQDDPYLLGPIGE